MNFNTKRWQGDYLTDALPVWEEDGFMMPQSNAILRMLGIRLRYYLVQEKEGDTEMKAHAIDSIVDFCEGIF